MLFIANEANLKKEASALSGDRHSLRNNIMVFASKLKRKPYIEDPFIIMSIV